ISCNSNDSSKTTTTTDSSKETNTATASEDPEVAKGLELVGQSDCFTCHKIVDASQGPSYEAVAAKYPDNDAVIDSVSKKIITGGSGNWGTIPMTPHPDISEADAKLMLKYILSLK
ncbi:MAG TPA: c-type cytochrome, partial [Chitinophagaceae bacterium]|nr:c-type cytochrome [Chitinophagaceae bacterium]